ncbi:hypothetical protein [Arsenicicoccus dermatophilus]|uniref:hypothetical protein n=1 Tax=Arsenicicoccus dermatophilus TaxID=1076331 RepID=UPI001F4CE12F|nr:hypothetical protein [Arsenicicoccus dermatophilus]MCH8611596.1 hypothetical protein [Arsenicicoccus dermatophilus]
MTTMTAATYTTSKAQALRSWVASAMPSGRATTPAALRHLEAHQQIQAQVRASGGGRTRAGGNLHDMVAHPELPVVLHRLERIG